MKQIGEPQRDTIQNDNSLLQRNRSNLLLHLQRFPLRSSIGLMAPDTLGKIFIPMTRGGQINRIGTDGFGCLDGIRTFAGSLPAGNKCYKHYISIFNLQFNMAEQTSASDFRSLIFCHQKKQLINKSNKTLNKH
jgi:hypothetical protein